MTTSKKTKEFLELSPEKRKEQERNMRLEILIKKLQNQNPNQLELFPLEEVIYVKQQ